MCFLYITNASLSFSKKKSSLLFSSCVFPIYHKCITFFFFSSFDDHTSLLHKITTLLFALVVAGRIKHLGRSQSNAFVGFCVQSFYKTSHPHFLLSLVLQVIFTSSCYTTQRQKPFREIRRHRHHQLPGSCVSTSY